MSRFQREAEVLASLNHPNIAAIYDLAKFGRAQFLVMELVDGETLADLSRAPTRMTASGMILGTVAYMSPEQARCVNVDRRTGIFAFGSVLYEMLTGKSAFGGNTASDLLAAILKTEPDWNALPADSPPRVLDLLKRCLEKDERRRWRYDSQSR